MTVQIKGLHASVVQEMADDPVWARDLLQNLGVEHVTGHRLRRLADDGGCGSILDWQLEYRPVAFQAARSFVRQHHSHCGAPAAWRFGMSLFNGFTMLGVVMVGNPVAPALCGRGTLEVNRLCIRRDIPRALAWNAASMLYGWSAREAERRGWSHIITYTRADEAGTSLRAAGWASLTAYNKAVTAMSPSLRPILRAVVCHDRTAREWAVENRDNPSGGLAMLRAVLADLAIYYRFLAAPRPKQKGRS